MTYEEFIIKYPCPDRVGMGYAGCTCTNNYRQDPRFVDCKAYGSHTLPKENCINCPYRIQHDKQANQIK